MNEQDDRLKKFSDALDPNITKFNMKKGEQEPSVDMIIEELQITIQGLQKAHDQLKTAWDSVAQHAMGITMRIAK